MRPFISSDTLYVAVDSGSSRLDKKPCPQGAGSPVGRPASRRILARFDKYNNGDLSQVLKGQLISLNKCFLSSYCMPGSVLGTGDTAVTCEAKSLTQLTLEG